MRDIDLRHFGPVAREPTPAENYDRLMDALEGIRAKLDTAHDVRLADLTTMLSDMASLCKCAQEATRRLESKCKTEGRP